MKIALAAFIVAAASSSALAADLPIQPDTPLYNAYVQADFLYGFGTIDRDIDAPGVGSGELETDFEVGAKIEAGLFLSDRIRVSTDLRYISTEFDTITVNGFGTANAGALDADGVQGFVNAAYELPLTDLGISIPFFERTKVFGIVGVGFNYVNLDFPGGSDDDTGVVGKVGLGSVYEFNERVALVSETDFIFGDDLELDGVDVDALSINSTIGLRFKF